MNEMIMSKDETAKESFLRSLQILLNNSYSMLSLDMDYKNMLINICGEKKCRKTN